MRHKNEAALVAFAILALISAEASAEPRSYQLPEGTLSFRPGDGKEVAENNCLVCHSSDYISTQPPGLGIKFWKAEVTRMRKAFGAQISEEDASAIADYLSQSY